MVRQIFCYLFVFLAIFVPIRQMQADISIGSNVLIDFANPKNINARGSATWSPANKLGLSSQGLGYDGPASDVIGGSILTSPFAVGLSWRPTGQASIQLQIVSAQRPDPNNIWIANGQAFVRYSPDTKNWSTWQALTRQEEPNPLNPCTCIFVGLIEIPQIQRQAYERLLSEYAGLNVPWSSDEEAAVKWIVKKDPHFFERNLPFAGYIQFLFEQTFPANQRISQLNADISVGMSGFQSMPKDPSVLKERDSIPWRYKAE